MSLTTQVRWDLHHLDVKSAFLNGKIEEEINMKQLVRFIVRGKVHNVFTLKKTVYWLK